MGILVAEDNGRKHFKRVFSENDRARVLSAIRTLNEQFKEIHAKRDYCEDDCSLCSLVSSCDNFSGY